MKLIVEKQGENVKAIKIEYTPTEALIINHAMRRYACDEEVNATDRKIMEQMLEVEPIFTDFEHKAGIVISQLRADRDRLQDAIEKIRGEIIETFESSECAEESGCLNQILEIIDKHTVESEVSDADNN
jgi:hypothetical protein